MHAMAGGTEAAPEAGTTDFEPFPNREEARAMKKLALTAIGALAATALTGAAAVPAISPAAGDARIHTKRLVSQDIDSHQISKNHFAGAAIDRHNGHIIGYEAFTAHAFPKQGRAVVWDSYALKNGIISVVVYVKPTENFVHRGRILNGTGKYHGVRGTIIARAARHNPEKTFVTLKYHF
jgi:hypothetical protein